MHIGMGFVGNSSTSYYILDTANLPKTIEELCLLFFNCPYVNEIKEAVENFDPFGDGLSAEDKPSTTADSSVLFEVAADWGESPTNLEVLNYFWTKLKKAADNNTFTRAELRALVNKSYEEIEAIEEANPVDRNFRLYGLMENLKDFSYLHESNYTLLSRDTIMLKQYHDIITSIVSEILQEVYKQRVLETEEHKEFEKDSVYLSRMNNTESFTREEEELYNAAEDLACDNSNLYRTGEDQFRHFLEELEALFTDRALAETLSSFPDTVTVMEYKSDSCPSLESIGMNEFPINKLPIKLILHN